MNAQKQKNGVKKAFGMILLIVGIILSIHLIPITLVRYKYAVIHLIPVFFRKGVYCFLLIYFGIKLMKNPKKNRDESSEDHPVADISYYNNPQKVSIEQPILNNVAQTVSNDNLKVEMALCKAVRERNTMEVYTILKNNQIDFNSSAFQKEHPLIIAIENKALDIVKLLIENGADISSTNGTEVNYGKGISAFILAANSDSYDIVKFMLTRNPDEILIYEALFSANQSNQVFELLLNHIPDINNNYMGTTPLIYTIYWMEHFAESKENALDRIRLLLERGADPNIRDNENKNAFDYATNKDVYDLLHNYRQAVYTG